MLQTRSLLVSMEAGRQYGECRISDIRFQRISLTPSQDAANFLLLLKHSEQKQNDHTLRNCWCKSPVHISKSPKDVLTA